MEEVSAPSLRSRSRSKTPLPVSRELESADGTDHVYKSGRKTPVKSRDTPTRLVPVEVEAIAEESEPEVFTSPPAHRTRNALKHKITPAPHSTMITSDYSSEEIEMSPQKEVEYLSEEAVQNLKNYSYEYEHVTTSRMVSNNNGSHSISFNSSHLGPGRISSLVGRSQASPSGSDHSNESFAESVLADSSRLSVDGTQHLPYKVYKSAGEYWNKYPKTDYTYSPLSKDRVELAPGQVAVPNMSRPSLRSARHGYSSTEEMLYSSTASSLLNQASSASNLRKRWTSENSNSYQNNARRYHAESDSDIEEVDNRQVGSRRMKGSQGNDHWWITSILISIWTTIVTTTTTIKSKITGRDRAKRYPYYDAYKSYSTRTDETSWFTSTKESAWRRKWWLILLLLLLLPLLYWLYGIYPWWENTSRTEIKVIKVVEKPGSFELTEDIINKIVLRVKESLPPIEIPPPQIIEKIVESSNKVDPILLDHQQQMIDKLTAEIVALKAADKSIDEQMMSNLISKHIMTTLVQILGLQSVDGKTVTNEEIKAGLMKESKDFVEDKLSGFRQTMSLDLDKLAEEIKLEMKTARKNLISQAAEASSKHSVSVESGCHCDDMIRRIVQEALLIYDADKTGKVDYALESAGGQVISTRCSQSYQPNSAVYSLFGIPLWYPSNSPRTVLTPGSSPGDCWAFRGFPGYLVIKLYTRINVTGFTMEHTSSLLTPHGQIESAPRKFTVWGLQDEMDREPVQFGSYEYLNDSRPMQFFPADTIEHNPESPPGYDMVELRIENNYGNPVYTCLYRFRVHGTPIDEFSFYGNNPER